jgi:hypothetical protein
LAKIYNLGIKIFSIGIQIPLFPLQTAVKGKIFTDISTFFPTQREKSFSNGDMVNGEQMVVLWGRPLN